MANYLNQIGGALGNIFGNATTTTTTGTGGYYPNTTQNQQAQQIFQSPMWQYPIGEMLTAEEVRWLKKLVNSEPLKRAMLMTLEKGEEQP